MKQKTFVVFLILVTTWGILRRIIPTILEIQEGEDMQLQLLANLNDEISCYLRTPNHANINLKGEDEFPEDDRIRYWSENNRCGVKVKNVGKNDEGWWRLTSKNLNETIQDAVNVKILDKISLIENKVSILSGLDYQLILAYRSKFCKVNHPSLKNELVDIADENCIIDINKPTEANAGIWRAEVGVKGKIHEIPSIVNVNISSNENIIYGYKQEPKFLRLYCNIPNYESEPDFCRFSQTNKSQVALQLSDGLRKGRFGYYGNGLEKKECGLTIEDPTPEDFGTWHCLTGKIGEKILGAYIFIPGLRMRGFFSDNIIPKSVTPVITTFSKELTLECSAHVTLRYCWFSGPNGTILTPNDSGDAILYSFLGMKLGIGECRVTIKNAQKEHNGTWTCHMGPDSPNFEYSANIDVRISETPLAAINKVIWIQKVEDVVSLQCKIVPNPVALKYCRFFSPSGLGIHINEEIQENSALENGKTKIWFSGNSTKMGDCGIMIRDITVKEIGIWKCAGRLQETNESNEIFDSIQLFLKEQAESVAENLTVGASVGISLGVIAILLTITFVALYLNKKYSGHCLPNHSRQVHQVDQSSDVSSGENSPRISQGIELVNLELQFNEQT
ncbi:uncharacterized protein LOC122511769 isoform X2 [Leptopilina heterotoma]|uniref:uncharacterized protein LOC122511769 isoform X2 n=1 Tax=Leptopilina heterotoma TaxID=63436 RepID=UPI001CA9B7A9|nr:uncharacterized protein LOC122511769 isoform X2 [Leptopilina heterotoma]